MFSDYLYVSGTTSTLREHFRASTERLVGGLDLKQHDLVVDIGSNDGTWLKFFKAAGLRVLGVDPAANLAELAQRDGVHTLIEFFGLHSAERILAEHGSPKLVTAAGVFFHLEELHSATAGVAKLCEAGAVFCVQAIYLAEMIRRTEFDNIYHEHLTYWTLRSIGALFAQEDLEVFQARVLPIHGGSLELFVAKRGRFPVDASVGRLRSLEDTLRLGEMVTYEAFARRVRHIETALKTILEDFRSHGRVTYAFGAPAKGATLLNSFNLTSEQIPLAVERNPLKIGRYIPKARIPIVDEAQTPDPDAYLMLPWNFLREFLQRKADFLERGGSFVVPIPEPAVITRENADQYQAG